MEPTYNSGDLVVAVKEDNYVKSDIIVYQPSSFRDGCAECHIVHRITQENSQGLVKTRGDNNSFTDQWWLDHSEILGKVVLHVPLGPWSHIIFSVKLWLFVLSFFVMLFVSSLVFSWWRAISERDGDDDGEDPPRKNRLRKARHAKKSRVPLSHAATFSLTSIFVVLSIVGASALGGLSFILSPLQTYRSAFNWTPPTSDPIVPGPGAGFTVVVTYTQPAARQICANIVVSTNNTAATPWTANLRYVGVPFNSDNTASNYQFSSGNYHFKSTTPTGDHFVVVGVGAYANVSKTTTRTFSICNYGTPNPLPNLEQGVVYTTSPTGGSYVATPSWYVCQTFTVSTVGASRFYVGWNTTIDATPLYNAFHTQSGTTGSFKMQSGDIAFTSLGANKYKVWGTNWGTSGVKDGSPQSFIACWS